MDSPTKCKCGADARVRRKSNTLWIECRNKKCDMRTHYYVDMQEPFDTDAKNRAAEEWNRLVKQ